MTLFSLQSLNSVIPGIIQPDTITISTTTTTTSTTTPFEIVVDMNDRFPSYQLATRNGSKPYTNGPQAKLIDSLHLYDKCQKDSSTIIADVGANLGDFGLYAAVCGCTVYMFEMQPVLATLFRLSIRINGFSSSFVHLYNNTVSDLPSNTTVELMSSINETIISQVPIEVQSIRLDDISWPSSIFLLKINLDDSELDVLRSAKKLFREKRIQQLILYYDTVANDKVKKTELIEHVRKVLKPEYIYIFHPTEKQVYGPLDNHHLIQLPSQKDKQRSLIGLYAVFDYKLNTTSIEAKPYDPLQFFA